MFTFKNYSKFVYPVYEAINISSQVATGGGAFDKAIKSLADKPEITKLINDFNKFERIVQDEGAHTPEMASEILQDTKYNLDPTLQSIHNSTQYSVNRKNPNIRNFDLKILETALKEYIIKQSSIFIGPCNVALGTGKSHTPTHSEVKVNIVKNEDGFINTKFAGGDIFMGVVGAGAGLKAHINEAKARGFEYKNIYFFECVEKYFLNIVRNYPNLKNIDNNTVEIPKDVCINSSLTHIRPTDTAPSGSPYPHIILDFLPLEKDSNTHSFLNFSNFKSNVKHIDFDVVSPLASVEKFGQSMINTFTRFTQLNSIVNVHTLRACEPMSRTLTEKQRVNELLQQAGISLKYIDIQEYLIKVYPYKLGANKTEIESTDKVRSSTLKHLTNRLLFGRNQDQRRMAVQKFADELDTFFNTNKLQVKALIQMYRGSTMQMISITVKKSSDSNNKTLVVFDNSIISPERQIESEYSTITRLRNKIRKGSFVNDKTNAILKAIELTEKEI